ncbi:MAG: hypothetical protein HY329_01145 [Chloroflexi bacterium]|nr:hypothetical protein [Chloroflexota bacterium]
MPRVFVSFPDDTFDHVLDLARKQRRKPADQVVVLVERALTNSVRIPLADQRLRRIDGAQDDE